ncbi:MAG: glycosyltransferase [Lysobacteraceae bacterium]
MRVLHLGKFYPPFAGGIERFSADLIGGLARRGLAQAALVHATPGQPRSTREWIEHDKVRLRETPCSGRVLFAPISPRWPLDFRRLQRDFRPDLLHIHAPNPSAFWLLGMPAARRLPWIVQWHADVPDDALHRGVRLAYPAYRQFEHRLLKRAARIVPTTDSYLEASRPLQAFRDRCHVIPLAIDRDDASTAANTAPVWPGNGLKLLAVGRLSYYKGFDVLLEALAACPVVSLLLVGEGERRGELEKQITRLGLGDRVRLTGQLDDAQLHAAYRDCDAFCLPSLDRSEAFGLVLLEAMRAGKPVVSSAVPGSGMCEVVVDGETGLQVSAGNAERLAAALQQLSHDPPLRHRLGENGRRRWALEYCLERVSAQWASLYQQVLDQSARDLQTAVRQ